MISELCVIDQRNWLPNISAFAYIHCSLETNIKSWFNAVVKDAANTEASMATKIKSVDEFFIALSLITIRVSDVDE